MTAPVVWTHRAERRLRQNLGPAKNTRAGRPKALEQIGGLLLRAFPGAEAIIVLDVYLGFRPRPGEYILLADVRGTDRPGTCIVKLAPDHPAKLAHEWEAWEECRPPGFRGDHVFMELTVRYDPPAEGSRPIALVYQDAQGHIDAERLLPLEEAFLGAVRFGAPEPRSVGGALRELFDRLQRGLYRGAQVIEPSPEQAHLNYDRATQAYRDLGRNLAAWETERHPRLARQEVNAALPLTCEWFIDPVDFLRGIVAQIRPPGPPAAGEAPAAGCRHWLPHLLRGSAHGDLHGRNVLVGLEDNRVRWPAVYDYEHVATDNLLGWDFVKLETELKMRAYPHVFRGRRPRDFVAAVQAFEADLAETTEHCRRIGRWPRVAGADPAQRLRALLLRLRKLAGRHLGEAAGRPERWLHEYYFLLVAYGVGTVKFENLTRFQRLGALAAAGVAAARYAWSYRPGPDERGRPPDLAAPLDPRGYRPALRWAWEMSRHGTDEDKEQAAKVLEVLEDRYPHALPVRFERAYNLVRRQQTPLALALLERLGEQFGSVLDEDTLCLWGRCYKDDGDGSFRNLDAPHLSLAERVFHANEADRHYRLAQEKYAQGYALAGHRFPGINLATLCLLRAVVARLTGRLRDEGRLLAESQRIAGELLARADTWEEKLPDDNVWVPATRGEAALLGLAWEAAEQHYQAALCQPNFLDTHKDSIRKQLERILRAYELLGLPCQGGFKDLDRFFRGPPE